MKRQVRRMVFETNSSSVHSLTMCSKEEYEKFEKDEYLMNWDKKFITYEQFVKELTEDGIDTTNMSEEEILEMAEDYDYYTYESYGSDYEWFEDTYKTPSGEEVVAFGYYGDN